MRFGGRILSLALDCFKWVHDGDSWGHYDMAYMVCMYICCFLFQPGFEVFFSGPFFIAFNCVGWSVARAAPVTSRKEVN